MAIRMGPVLQFRGVENDTWKLSALLVIDGSDPELKLLWSEKKTLSQPTNVAARLIKTFPKEKNPTAKVLRFDFSVPQTNAEQQIFYRVGASATYTCFIPAAGAAPQMAYASCNGFSDPKLMKKVRDKNHLWKHLAKKHDSHHYHLMLLGGDQVYSDSIWVEVPELKAWFELDWNERLKAKFTDMEAAVDRFYFDIYTQRWSQTEPAQMLASIPSLMMWDDHDIFDGWGSYPKKQLTSAVYQGIFRIATEYFRIFQLGIKPDETPVGGIQGQGYFSYAHQIGNIAVLALDMRSERRENRVMSLESWNAVLKWVNGLENCSHLLVLSSIPVVHPDFSAVEKLLGVLPGQQELEDDLKDHWHSLPHRHERLRLIHRLFDFSATNKCRVTLLSGDVHVAAVGVLQSDRSNVPANANVINQLTSSGIVHPSPPGMVLYFLESVGDRVETVDRDITAEMLEFPATRRRFIGARNWLSLEPDDSNRIWANWHVEGETQAYTKVVHAI